MVTPTHVLILAAGRGKRMYSKLPKVLHPVLFRPMVHYVIDRAREIPPASVSVIVGHGEELVRKACAEYSGLQYFQQKEQLGTAHAVRMAESFLSGVEGNVVVLSGDVILLRKETLARLLQKHTESGAACTVLTAELETPHGYGRILRTPSGGVAGIREEVDCTDAERKIREVNSGIYCFRAVDLVKALGQVSDQNHQKEYYLTDVVEILTRAPGGAASFVLEDPAEMTGINDRNALHEVEAILQARTNRALMLRGVTLHQPQTTFIDPHCEIAADVEIEGGCVLVGASVAAGTVIESGVRLLRSSVAESCRIKQGSYIEESRIARDCLVGPYAHLRPGSVLGPEVKIGNFVELKKATMGPGAKASHLSYVGDAEVGADVNLGCGFITCNFDGGPEKHRTVIEDGVFVGSDSQMVAPVGIGKGSYVASGTTVTRDVPANALAISRTRQENKEGYAAKIREQINKRTKLPKS